MKLDQLIGIFMENIFRIKVLHDLEEWTQNPGPSFIH